MIVERGLAVQMRDGVVLRADVYRPEGGSTPAILNRTPYDRSFGPTPPAAIEPERAVDAGFALVCQDVRGQHASDGEFYPFRSEGSDGHDSVDWVAAQDWCSGEVGMAGRSYSAATQWLAAAKRPSALRAICPVVTGSDYYDGWIYQGGAFQLGFNLFWVSLMTASKSRGRLDEAFAHLPLSSPPLLDRSPAGRFYRDWLEHCTDDEYWRTLAINRCYSDVQVPAFNVGGWYDLFLSGTLENFQGLREHGGSPEARSGTRLLIGPWAHGSTYGAYPDHGFAAFAPNDRVDLAELELAFLARHLKDEGSLGDEAPIRIFVMGVNRWRDEDRWPPRRVGDQRWYLRREEAGGDGLLCLESPGEEAPERYTYDPADPAPTVGGPTSLPGRFMKTNSGPLDQAKLNERDDVLSYCSAALEREIEVTGPISLVLHAASSAPDTDFVAKLCDVDPVGTFTILAEGVLRARFRESFQHPRPVEPHNVYEYVIDLVATSNVFLPGHRIGLMLTSSSFPRFDRNLNTGGRLGAERLEEAQAAQQTIFHDGRRPSHLVLSVAGA